jgi:phage shock protein A
MKMSLRGRLELWIETVLSAAEDPQERIRALVRDLRARLDQGRRALGMTIVLEKRLLDELVAAEDAARAAEALSKEALARGEEAAARESAARALELRAAEEKARARWKEQRALADRVRQAFALASKRTQEVAHAHSVLLARAHCAEASKAISDTLSLFESPQIRAALERAKARVEEKEAAAR